MRETEGPPEKPADGVCDLWQFPISARPDLAREESRTAQQALVERYLGAGAVIDRTCRRCGEQHGRPTVRGPIDLSVSHTREWLVLAVVGSGRVGVDLEQTAAARDLDALTTSTLTAAERIEFAQVPSPERAAWFLRRWTRKEAAVKLTGHGLAVRFDALDTGGPLAIADGVAPDWPDEDIHLTDVRLSDDLVLALATTVPLTEVRVHGPLPTPAGPVS
jgi:4'-phosphopantetheinyl transferase